MLTLKCSLKLEASVCTLFQISESDSIPRIKKKSQIRSLTNLLDSNELKWRAFLTFFFREKDPYLSQVSPLEFQKRSMCQSLRFFKSKIRDLIFFSWNNMRSHSFHIYFLLLFASISPNETPKQQIKSFKENPILLRFKRAPIQTISICTEDFYTCYLNLVEMASLYKTTCVTCLYIVMDFHLERVCHHEGQGWIIIHEVTRLRPSPVDVILLCTFPKTGSKFNLKIRRKANELSSSCEMDKNHASCFRVYYPKKVRTYNTYSNPKY